MKYDQKYPNAKPMQMVETTIMCAKRADSCYRCGALTKFIDIDFEAFICSEECDEELTGEFFQYAMRR